MRKFCLFIIMFLLMQVVAFTWKVMPMSQEDLTMFYDNRWALTLVTSALCGIAGGWIAKEDD